MEELNPSEISQVIKQKIDALDTASTPSNEGTIVFLADGIARIHGLGEVMNGELIEFEHGVMGMALNLEVDSVGAVILGDYKLLAEGGSAKCTGRILEVPVGEALMGRVVDALGNPIDGKGEVQTDQTAPVEKVAPGVISRKSVDQPVQLGIKAVDSMVPIGRGQRELIIGDRQTGKTAIAIDAIINQKDTGVKCIYVAIGQKQSSIAQVVRTLEQYGAMENTIVVVAAAADPAPMQYIAPFAACSMGEYFRDRGEDALIIYDDLSKQAVAYRQMSLLLRRPPGREAYPGDVFYLHSRLLERAARVNEEYVENYTNGEVKGKTGSLTALPIIETQAGDVSAFVPTNVISITDGQIFLESSLFSSGLKPAMDPGISVSRVGGSAQIKSMKKVSGTLKLDQAQFRELQAFAKFGSDLDPVTLGVIEKGKRNVEILKQAQNDPFKVEDQVSIIYLGSKDLLKAVPVEKVKDFEKKFIELLNLKHKKILNQIKQGKLTDEVTSTLEKVASDLSASYE